MPLDTLTNKTASMTMNILGEEINALYYPLRVSGADLDRIIGLRDDLRRADAREAMQIIRACAAFLARVIQSWDFRETADGPFVALTEDSLFNLGTEVLGALIGAFAQEMRLGETNGNGSPAPLPPTRTNRSRKSSPRN